ncbi:MAG: sigma 54-interacting transcriptional regulator [Firmicutes bacterium]|nr:sigma 54-interacting transcriptional regulator [Bacillota bacterium]
MLKLALVVEDQRGIDIFRILQETAGLEIVGLVDLSGDLSWVTAEERQKYYITTDLSRVAALPDLNTVVAVSNDQQLQKRLTPLLKTPRELVTISPQSFLMTLLSSGKQLIETRLLKGELWAILNSVQDPIEVVDDRGVIKYVNPAFTRVSGIPEKKRVGQNIFEVSPYGALAQSLILQKPVVGYRTYVGGSDAEVISNASPIIVDGEIRGAVVVFQLVNDILKLMDQLNHSNAVIENLYAQIDQISSSRWCFEDLVGKSQLFLSTVELARKASRSGNTILLIGEVGVGKGIFAQAIHNYSSHRGRPLIRVDCSSIPEAVQEVELFGCEKGALTGVVQTRLGKIELAREGTLYLKGVTSLSPYVQDKLAKVWREGEFYRIGGEEPIKIELRLVACTTFEPKTALRKGYLSGELYQGLSAVEIFLSPLRKRLEDLPLLAEHFMGFYNHKLGKSVRQISHQTLQWLAEYDWPGNISELRNVMERAVIVAEGPVIEPHHLSPYAGKLNAAITPVFDEIMPLERMEQILLKQALNRYGESLEGKKKAARALNISLATLYNKLKKYRSNL